ncbi:PREDICTED: putative RNA polymerase II subunit B1 CTD phosphatase RPAP2 [Trachymyrmex cornetzi]|uniref:putative RNA polymerase II subunit B1 CTD phosphatase RPAP2 n=1 Tax=Trachymyrmex cornetzi TaxID=471704 RepID=UPI00084F36A6|nr:PREDICTED: putative RNA polymerase II subunit B1 CTD phosphatase RPAP2 [Trachymyrmex cornetzi]
MSTTKKQMTEKKKLKKMSKEQMQLAIIKKKQCDAKALAIVMQLLELHVDPDWLLQNLGFISKNHMEDVIEERALVKLCGYVLCPNQLTVIIRQQYHISTRKNKVYDVSKRKNFCSSLCFGAANFLLEQMLESPLWLREKEDIPVFQILPVNSKPTCGEEIDVAGESNYDNNNIQQVDVNLENLEIEIAGQSGNILHLHKHNRDTKDKINVDIFDNEILQPQLGKVSNNEDDISERLQPQTSQSVEISNKNDENETKLEPQIDEVNNSLTDKNMKQSHLDKMYKNNTVISSASTYDEYRKIGETSRINKSKQYRLKKTDNAGVQNNIYLKVAIHVEESVKEWVTKNTLCLLMGEENERNQLLEKFTQYDKYQQLCKKLNKLQMEDEKEERDFKKNDLKPLPHFSVLQEDGKKMELKVRAFYEGQMKIAPSEDSNEELESKDNVEPILPLTDTYTPNALRHRIFLDNLNKILPDLMCALTTNTNISSLAQCTYNNEKYSLIKILTSTFNLSATNIVFKTAEWILVGLVIIKMLSLIDTQLQLLLRSKQASMYTSMILTTYKLDSNYLDRFIMEITNNVDAFKSNDNNAK